MQKRCAIIALSIIFSFCCRAYSHAAAVDQELDKGMSLYKHEYYEEALEIFKAAREKDPGNSLAAYYLGLTYKKTEDYRSAKPHLEAAVTLSPKVEPALIELIDLLYKIDKLDEAKKWIELAEKEQIRPAQIAFLKGLVLLKAGEDLDGAAQSLEKSKNLDTALSDIADYYASLAYLKSKKLKEARKLLSDIVAKDASTSIAAFANQYIDSIDRMEKEQKPLKLTFGAAYQYDDNVVLKPNDSSLAASITKKADSRMVYSFRGEYDFKPKEKIDIKTAYSLNYSDQFDLNFYDTVSHEALLQPAYSGENFAVAFPGTFTHVLVDDRSYLAAGSAGAVGNRVFAKDQMGQLGVAYKHKNYLWTPSSTDENRDASEYTGWLGWYKFFENKGFLNLKYTANYDDTKGRSWEYFGNKGTLTAMIPVLEKVKLTLVGEFFLENFLNTHSAYDIRRRDKIYLFSGLLAFEVFKGAEIQLQYTFIDNNSNIGVYDYDRNVYSAGVQYKF